MELNIGHNFKSFETGAHKNGKVFTGKENEIVQMESYEIYRIFLEEKWWDFYLNFKHKKSLLFKLLNQFHNLGKQLKAQLILSWIQSFFLHSSILFMPIFLRIVFVLFL